MLYYDHKNIKYAKELRKNATPWENKLWYQFLKGLKDKGYKFVRQKSIGPYIADFYCHQYKLVIELDGGGHYTDSQITYDNKRTAYFNSLNINEIRIINTDIDKKFAEVCTLIYNKLTNS